MIGWYIGGAVLCLLLLILFLPVGVQVEYRDEVFLWLRIAGFRIPIFPVEEEEEDGEKPPRQKKKKKGGSKTQKPSEKGKAEEKKQKQGGLKDKVKEITKYQGVSGLLSLLKDLAGIAGGTLKKLWRHVVVKKFDLLLTIGGEDAAETAVLYGKLCGVVYPAVGIILQGCKCRKYGVTVQPDFDKKETDIRFSFIGRILPIFVISSALGGLFRLLGRMVRANRELEEAKESQLPVKPKSPEEK